MKKGFKIAGMVVSVALVIFGVLIMCGVFKDGVSYPGNASTGYDSGYAIFGADFYNYVCNNSAEAASAARAAAYNAIDIIDILTGGFGAIIIAMGLLGFCFFGMMPVGAFKVQNISARTPAPVPVSVPVPAPVQASAPVQTTAPADEIAPVNAPDEPAEVPAAEVVAEATPVVEAAQEIVTAQED